MPETNISTESGTSKPEKKHSLFSRIGFALAFATVGAKLGTLGMLGDAASVLKGENITFGEKLRGVFNGKLFAKINEKIIERASSQGQTFNMTSALKASSSVFKYTLILTGIGAVLGGVLGWVRGGRVEHAKDIFSHPIKSLKIVLGPKPKEPELKTPIAASSGLSQQEDAVENSTRWQNNVASRAQENTVARA